MGHRVLFQNKIVFLSLKIVFVLANSVDPDEMLHFMRVFTVCDSVTSHILETLYNVQTVKVCTCCNYSLNLYLYSINLAFSCSKIANLEY